MHFQNVAIAASFFLGLSLAAPAPEPEPAPAPLPEPVNPQGYAATSTTRSIDCIDWDTPESCDIFCYYVFCRGGPSTWRYTGNQDFKDHNRDESGTNQQPFKGNNLQKYNTRSRGSSYTWTDECPVASSLQGGEGANTGIHAIVQGARDDEQRQQAKWVSKLWAGVPEAGDVTLSISRFDPKKSPNCAAWAANDRQQCNGQYFFQKGPKSGRSWTFQQMPSGNNPARYG